MPERHIQARTQQRGRLRERFRGPASSCANSDEAARGFRDNVAQDSDMKSLGVWRLAGE